MEYDKNNIFARIIRGEIPAKKIYEDEFVLAIEDIEPATPSHILVLPKGEYISFDDFTRNASSERIKYFFEKITEIARINKLESSGYRLITNHGSDAAQSVPHFHVHILGGKKMGALLG
ncbi:MAG: HIT domain-containing protein [Pseudomonadota bacterium]